MTHLPEKRTHAPQSEEAIAERKRLLLEACRHAKTPTKAAKALGISPSNVTYWKQTDPEFRLALAQVEQDRKMERADLLEDVIYDMARGINTKDSLPSYPAARFLLTKYAPEEFGEKVDHRHSGQITHTHIPAAQPPTALPTITEAQFRELLAGDDEDDEDEDDEA